MGSASAEQVAQVDGIKGRGELKFIKSCGSDVGDELGPVDDGELADDFRAEGRNQRSELRQEQRCAESANTEIVGKR